MKAAKKDPNLKTVKAEKRLKTVLYYSIELLIDVLLIYVVVHGFSLAFNFSYNVFHDSAKDSRSKEYMIVTIEPDSSSRDIAKKLYDSGVIADKNVMWGKIVVGEYGGRIRPGRYGLSPSMTYKEILTILTKGNEKEEEKPVVDTTKEAIPDGASVVPNHGDNDGEMPDESAGGDGESQDPEGGEGEGSDSGEGGEE
jgi:hypothetical protein